MVDKAPNRLFLRAKVTDDIIVETTQFGEQYVTYYRINGKRIGTLEYYKTEGQVREGHEKWSLMAWPLRTPVEVEDRGRRLWKAIKDHWRWLDQDDGDEEYYDYWWGFEKGDFR